MDFKLLESLEFCLTFKMYGYLEQEHSNNLYGHSFAQLI